MGVLIKMSAPRFERTPIKTHGGSLILSKCTKCGVKRLVAVEDGSAHAWESKHRCATSNSGSVNEKEVG
jgi:hypothetical protein